MHAKLRADHRRGVTMTYRRTVVKRSVVHRHTKRAVRRAESRPPSRSYSRRARGMAAVVAYARAQVGKRYVFGATGPGAFDCSGLTQAAYRRAGIHLPHQSGAQAARSRKVPRSQARPGDLVVGNGHVGIYVGRGMMVDAGNPRVGVAYRKMYADLWVERF